MEQGKLLAIIDLQLAEEAESVWFWGLWQWTTDACLEIVHDASELDGHMLAPLQISTSILLSECNQILGGY